MFAAARGMVLDRDDPNTRSVGSIFLSLTITADQAAELFGKGASPHTYSDQQTRIGASWLLREAEYQLGQFIAPGVRLSNKHFTRVAHGTATSTDFATAAAFIRQHVRQVTGVTLTFEPDLIGDEPAFYALTDSAGTTKVTLS